MQDYPVKNIFCSLLPRKWTIENQKSRIFTDYMVSIQTCTSDWTKVTKVPTFSKNYISTMAILVTNLGGSLLTYAVLLPRPETSNHELPESILAFAIAFRSDVS